MSKLRDDLEIALREMLRASQAYGREVSNEEQRLSHLAWDVAQNVLSRTVDGKQSAL
jgi:hypothetical protein